MTLLEFLWARLDEDEAAAQKDVWVADHASAGVWKAWYGHNLPHSDLKADDQPIARFGSPLHQGDVMLAARFKPATVRGRAERVLAEVEAKRRIVAHHSGTVTCDTCSSEDWAAVHPCPTLRLLALPYADHPDYDPAWRPE